MNAISIRVQARPRPFGLDELSEPPHVLFVSRLVGMLLALCFASSQAAAVEWPATSAGRAAARDVLVKFEMALDATDSASEALRLWCADHHLAHPAVIRAERARDVVKPADATVRRALGATPDEPVRYRRVRLLCGDRVLSEADNWYRPGKLTATMNDTLDTTDRPFGVVVGPLGFHRRTLGIDWLFDPLGAVIAGPDAKLTAPRGVLRHRAVLISATGEPFSVVVETYTDEVLSR